MTLSDSIGRKLPTVYSKTSVVLCCRGNTGVCIYEWHIEHCYNITMTIYPAELYAD